jgi:hypothetical protein
MTLMFSWALQTTETSTLLKVPLTRKGSDEKWRGDHEDQNVPTTTLTLDHPNSGRTHEVHFRKN